MKVAVIGAGAMGSIYGAHLARGGHDVWLIDLWQEHVDTINQYGLKIFYNNNPETVKIKATSNPLNVKHTMDLLLVFVKSYHTEPALKNCMHLIGDETKLLTLQNGVGNVDILERFVSKSQILAGTTAHGANVRAPGQINHAGKGKTIIGRIDGNNMKSDEELVSSFIACGLETELRDGVEGLIWDKLLVNVGINPLTALLSIKNGTLLENEETEKLMEILVGEAWEVAKKGGLLLSHEDPVGHVKAIARATGENKSSMLQDILKGRMTEIDFINGAIVYKGKEWGVATPYNELITLLIKAKEKLAYQN